MASSQRYLAFKEFFQKESSGGILLVAAAICALICANSALAPYYNDFLHAHLGVSFVGKKIGLSLLHWINDGLMAIFFLLVGLEIKRELLAGELSGRSQALLPAAAACGGVVLPAIIYVAFNTGDPQALRGWAIPSATDIAFSLGVLALFAGRMPFSLKVFLTAVAVIDDLIAVLIIAFFYAMDISVQALMAATLFAGILFAFNRAGVTRLAPYMGFGVLLWLAMLYSGVHATIAGVLLGLAIPLRIRDRKGNSPLHVMEKSMHSWVAFGILPIFAFANSGVSLQGLTLDILASPLVLGITVGLFLGKQLGIFGVAWLMIKLGWARLPSGATWNQLYGVCIIAGIGFTMSLFIGGLSFTDSLRETETRLGIILGSLISAVIGYVWMKVALRKRRA